MPCLLDLPASVRLQIYRLSGLMIDTEVRLSRPDPAHPPKVPAIIQHQRQNVVVVDNGSQVARNFSSPLALLLTCRQIHREVVHLLLSSNHFHAANLESLRQLPAASFSSVRSLSLTLRSCREETRVWVSRSKNAEKIRPLDAAVVKDRELLAEWEEIARFIGSHLRPRSLDFWFICDVVDEQTAQLAANPILRYFPILHQCALRLSPHRDELLMMKAASVGRQACGRDAEPQMPFRFRDLPVELQLRVLAFTDLVTPLCSLFWNGTIGYYLENHTCMLPCGPPYYSHRPRLHLSRTASETKWMNHGACSHSHQHWLSALRADVPCDECRHRACRFRRCPKPVGSTDESTTRSVCMRLNSAYSTNCQCWGPPRPLFLVSRAFTKLAESVFFTFNHFQVKILRDRFGSGLPVGDQRYDTFFREAVPEHCLRHLRSLSMVISDYHPAGRREHLVATVLHIQDKLESLQYLKLELDGAFEGQPSRPDYSDAHGTSPPMFGQEAGIGIIRDSVKLYWPLESIVSQKALPSLRLFSCVLPFGGPTVIYVARRSDAILPGPKLDTHGLEPGERYVERPWPSNPEDQERNGFGGAEWTEGLFSWSGDEGYGDASFE